jgi:D-mannonate dehydratase
MGKWTKDADWLPLQNAKAQVDFYKKDLEYAQAYLKYVLTFDKKKMKGYDNILKIAKKDVDDSKKNLAKSLVKLEESKKLE